MGLKEIIQVGASLTRDTITITDINGSGSVVLGPTYAILEIQTSDACRLRLYDTIEALEDVTEISREFGDLNIPNSISLVGDFSMSAADTYTINPTIYGHPFDAIQTYYRINKTVASPTAINITRYLLEDPGIKPAVGGQYTQDNRRVITFAEDIAGGEFASGSFSSFAVPNTYLLISASTDDGEFVRVRMYATSSALYDNTEKLREFSTEPSADVRLIVDMTLSGSSPVYFTPKIIGANLQNLKNDLNELIVDQNNVFGTKEFYYIMENLNGGPSSTVPVNVCVYSLEE